MHLIITVGTIVVAAFATQLTAHEVVSGSIEIVHPTIVMTHKSAKSAAGFMVISNEADSADNLLAIESGVATKIMIHKNEFVDDVARMILVPKLEIGANDTVILEPGEMHLMFMGLSSTMKVGQMIPAILVFESAGRVSIEFLVEDNGEGHTDHSAMDDN